MPAQLTRSARFIEGLENLRTHKTISSSLLRFIPISKRHNERWRSSMNSMSTKQSRNKLASHSSHQRRLQNKHWRKVRHSSALTFSCGQDTGQHIRYHFVEQNSCREHRILATSDPLTV